MREFVYKQMDRASVQADDVARIGLEAIDSRLLYALPHRNGRWVSPPTPPGTTSTDVAGYQEPTGGPRRRRPQLPTVTGAQGFRCSRHVAQLRDVCVLPGNADSI